MYVGVGKTSLIQSVLNKPVSPGDIPTTLMKVKGREYQLFIEDCKNIEDMEFEELMSQSHPSFNNTDIFIVAFSINDKKSYQNVSNKWICLIEKYTERRKIFMLGLKCDLRLDGSACVTFDEAVKKSDRNKCLGYYECSIVDNTGKYQRFIELYEL